MKSRLLTASAAVLFVGTATSAFAQDDQFLRNRNMSVRERPRPDYEAIGIGSGGIKLLPQLTVTATHDDNIFATTVGEVDDTIISTTADIALISDWNVHAIGATARVRHDAYTENAFEDQTIYNLSARGRLDGTRNFSINGAVVYDGLVEPRTASGNPSASIDPIEFSVSGFDLGTNITLNQLRFRISGSQRDVDYDDGRTFLGAIIDQDFRDEKISRASVRADYAISPDTSFFLEAAMNKRDYDVLTPGTLVIRDNDGTELYAGADFDLTNLIRGSIQLGYLEQDFDDPVIPDTDSFSGRVAVEWFPTEVATVTVRADRSVQDTGLAQTSAFLSTNYSVQLDYELLRNLIVTARIGAGDDEYQGFQREDKRTNATLSAVWLLNRRWGVGAAYNFNEQDSRGLNAGPDFKVNRISASLTLQY
jgi:hypothetical protein